MGPPQEPQPLASTSSAFSFKNNSLDQVLEDLSSRFILNLPEEELISVERICFQVEQAHWYYEDFIREEEPRFPSMALKTFSRHLFHACPLLQHWSLDHDQAFQDFLDYKTTVPVCGVIMLNPSWTKCVLVKGWKQSSSWSFPRGKINADEPEHECAIRETYEETGYDASDQIIMDAVIRITIKDQRTTFFVVPNVPEDTQFATRTRKEISKIEWFPLADLPLWKKGIKAPSSSKFYGISPIIGPLKGVIKNLKQNEWELKNSTRPISGRAVQSNGAHTPSQTRPIDPAILSAAPAAASGDHLSRLLGGLEVSSADSTPNLASATAFHHGNGALPTPDGTPVTSSAVVKIIHKYPLDSTNNTAPVIFASPTPPHSGDPTKSLAEDIPNSAQKSKFNFVSPFDALASPTTTRAQKHASAAESTSTAINNGASNATISPTLSPVSIKAGRPRAPSAHEHFAPASIARARYGRSRQPSQSFGPGSASSGVGSPPVMERPASAFPVELTVTKKAQHLALLESLTSDLLGGGDRPLQGPVRGNKTPEFAPPSHMSTNEIYHGKQTSELAINNDIRSLPWPQPEQSSYIRPQSSAPQFSAKFTVPVTSNIGVNGYYPPQPPVSTANGSYTTNDQSPASIRPSPSYHPQYANNNGPPIPVVPPAVPVDRNQLLSLINGHAPPPLVLHQRPMSIPLQPRTVDGLNRNGLIQQPHHLGQPPAQSVSISNLGLAAPSSGAPRPPKANLLSILNQPQATAQL